MTGANNSVSIVTAGNKPIKNMDFVLVAITGSSNIEAIKKSTSYNSANTDIGVFTNLLFQSDVAAPPQPGLEKAIAQDFTDFLKKSGNVQSEGAQINFPYRSTGIKNLSIRTLESWRGRPPGAEITDAGYFFRGFPPHIISYDNMNLLFGFNKTPQYSPFYQGFGEISEWLKQKPTAPPMIVYEPAMHSETAGDFSFVVTFETSDNRTISDTCKITLVKN